MASVSGTSSITMSGMTVPGWGPSAAAGVAAGAGAGASLAATSMLAGSESSAAGALLAVTAGAGA